MEGAIAEIIGDVDSFSNLFFHMLQQHVDNLVDRWAMILYQIWKERNSQLWTAECRSAAEAVHVSATILQEWRSARVTRLMSRGRDEEAERRCLAWHRPENGYWKVNVDAAFFDEPRQTGLGMILHDDHGTFVAARSVVISGRLEVGVGEAMSFFEALSWVKGLGLSKVVVEGDSKIVVDALKSHDVGTSAFGDYVRASKSILSVFCDYSTNFVKRETNIMAHNIARVFREFGNVHCWVDPPDCVVGLPFHPCRCNNEN